MAMADTPVYVSDTGDVLFDVSKNDEEKEGDKLLENCIFSIDVEAIFTYPNYQDDDDDNDDDDDDDDDDKVDDIYSYECVTIKRTHEVQFYYLNRNPQSVIHEIIVSMHVPVKNYMIEEILDCANDMSNDDHYKNRKVLRMQVSVDVPVTENPLPYMDEEIDDQKVIPASKEAIEGLEKVVVENPIDCAIFLEELSAGFEAKRMPCSHLFHGHCIATWLGKSKFCPICRFEFELPSLVYVWPAQKPMIPHSKEEEESRF